jgi:hypothetical protein
MSIFTRNSYRLEAAADAWQHLLLTARSSIFAEHLPGSFGASGKIADQHQFII